MLEQRRLDYLQAMGVVQWMPRQPLPHGPAPRWLPEQVQRVPHNKPSFAHPDGHIAHPPASQLLHESSSRSGLQALSSLLGAAEKRPQSAPEHQAAPSISAAVSPAAAVVPAEPSAQLGAADRAGAQETPQFHLKFYRSHLPAIWVCDAAGGDDFLPTLQFGVQRALLGQATFVPEPTDFRWPFIASPHEDQTTPVALQALKAQWQFMCAGESLVVITLGADSQHWLRQIGVSSDFHAPSAAAVAGDAALKRRLWLTLSARTGVSG